MPKFRSPFSLEELLEEPFGPFREIDALNPCVQSTTLRKPLVLKCVSLEAGPGVITGYVNCNSNIYIASSPFVEAWTNANNASQATTRNASTMASKSCSPAFWISTTPHGSRPKQSTSSTTRSRNATTTLVSPLTRKLNAEVMFRLAPCTRLLGGARRKSKS